ncbi:beta-1,3-glucan-binding protein [Zopfochytrium polystomum]|nr:beta-1,3-glucan-binding protein [Zopfochytrium polystomum]
MSSTIVQHRQLHDHQQPSSASQSSGSGNSGNSGNSGSGSGSGSNKSSLPMDNPVVAQDPIVPASQNIQRRSMLHDGGAGDTGTIRRPTMRRGANSHAIKPEKVNSAAKERRLAEKNDPGRRWLRIIPLFGLVPTFLLVGFIIYLGIKSVPTWKYCQVFEDNFDTLDSKYWNHEVALGGFGNGEFEWTSADDENSFVKNGILHIRPTLTSDSIPLDKILYGYTLDLTSQGCVGTKSDCVVFSNWTNNTIIPPVKSARLNTKGKVNIKYGKGEIKLKMPMGDWLWPAVWMMPEESVYGAWPKSGEIDIIESRGNARGYAYGSVDYMYSALHYGVDYINQKTESQGLKRRHGSMASTFRTIGWEWTPNYFLTWLDSPLRTNLYIPFDQNLFTKGGGFPSSYKNGTAITNPWSGPGSSLSTPFDQKFYLILNVAVGGTNGWFPDDDKKPWKNSDGSAMVDFLTFLTSWYNTTWPAGDDRNMQVDYVKMWKVCDIN